MKKLSFLFLFLSFLFLVQTSCAQESNKRKVKIIYLDKIQPGPELLKKEWADSVYNQLSLKEKIGQLFMVAAYSGGQNSNQKEIDALIANHQIGGIIFMQGTPEAQALLTNRFQKNAQVPLLIGMDAEWGLGMRLTGVKDYPKEMLLGAAAMPGLVYKMGKAVAQQCKRLGVHINFAPVVDINNNPDNPIINFRSFGEDKILVSRLGISYMKGLQDNGIVACAKHFPGHGDVSVDSHQDLPVIKKSKKQLEELELFPFQQMIKEGVQSIMIAHLSIPSLDSSPNLPSTLSPRIVKDLLKTEMGFKGLVFTDALNMKGVTKYYPDGETDLRAFLAGNDVLLFSQNVPLAISKIEKAIESGKAKIEDLEISVKKILQAKYSVGLHDFQEIKTEYLTKDLNRHTDSFFAAAADASITLINEDATLFQKLNNENSKIAYLSINNKGEDFFKKELANHFKNLKVVSAATNNADVLIVGIHSYANYPGKSGHYGLNPEQIQLMKNLRKNKNVLFVIFGNPYLMKHICGAASVLITYEDNFFTEQSASSVIKGILEAKGRIPVQVCQ